MTRFSALFVALAAVLAAMAAEYSLNVQNFSSLTVIDGIAVDYIQRTDSAGWARFVCEPELASKIMFNNNRDKLTVRTASEDSPIVGMPRVTVYSSTLRNIENDGDSLLIVTLNEHVENLSVKQIGNGRIEVRGIDAENVNASVAAGCGTVDIEGTTGKLKLQNIGTGQLDAADMVATEAKCYLFGSGPIHCSPAEKLIVYGAGNGHVILHTSPSKISNRALGVTVHQYNDCSRAEQESLIDRR